VSHGGVIGSGDVGGARHRNGMVDVREWLNEGKQREAMQRDRKAVIEWIVNAEKMGWEIRRYRNPNRDEIGKGREHSKRRCVVLARIASVSSIPSCAKAFPRQRRGIPYRVDWAVM
jgi:hypothetical protein